MWPWGHLAIGYLFYSTVCRLWSDGPPRTPSVVVLVVGTQFPDLVDKPLAWSVAVLPTGRTLGHSLLIALPVIAVTYLLLRRRHREQLALPFGIGYVSHILTDLPPAVVLGDLAGASFLLWPLLPSPEYELEQSFLAHFAAFEFSPYEVFQLCLFGIATVVWVLDDHPGLPFGTRLHRSGMQDDPDSIESD